MLPTFWKNMKVFCLDLFGLLQQMKILSGGKGAKTGCSHSGFRFPKHGERNGDTSNTRERNSDTSSENWKNQASEKLEPVWRLIPQLSILWCGRIGAEKCSIGGLSFQFWLRFHTSPIHPNFQWRSNCTWLDPVFVANVREMMKWCHPPLSSRSNAFEKSWPVFVSCQSSYYSILKKRILYSWMPPPPSLPARGRSKGEWTKIALFLGRTRVSKLCTRGKSYNLFDQERQKIFATTSVGRHWSESGDMSGPVCSCTSQTALRRFYPRQISAQKLSVVCTAFLCICLFFTFYVLPHDEIFLPFKYLYKVAE